MEHDALRRGISSADVGNSETGSATKFEVLRDGQMDVQCVCLRRSDSHRPLGVDICTSGCAEVRGHLRVCEVMLACTK